MLLETAYDTFPYPATCFPQTHPDRLATLASWFGLHPAPVEQCRVLELGCGRGGNLIPMALGLPASQFLGVDLAASAIDEAQQLSRELGLNNISLECQDLGQLRRDLGQFDYIIAHGLYSWVAPPLQERILQICAEHLAPHGVAYVSYNAYPGWHMRGILRDALLFEGQSAPRDGQAQRVQRALDFTDVLRQGWPDDPHAAFLRLEVQTLHEADPAVVFHDDLATINAPVYFHEFIARAQGHGLQYLAEASISDMQDSSYAPQVVEALRQVEAERGLVAREQYLDFLKLRRFRQTLLCGARVAVDRAPAMAQIRSYWLSAAVQPESAQPDVRSRAVEAFRGPNQSELKTDHPLAKAALISLGARWPGRIPFDELCQLAHERTGRPAEAEDDADLARILTQSFASGVVELHTCAPAVAREVSARPIASPLARLQARAGNPRVANLLHRMVSLDDPVARYALQLLDGTRDHSAILTDLLAWLRRQPDLRVDERGLAQALAPNLDRLIRLGLLLA